MTLAVRAASLSGSAAILGLAVVAALTMSYAVVRDLPTIDRAPVVAIVEPEPPPPPIEEPIVLTTPLEPTIPFSAPSLPQLVDTSEPRAETPPPVSSGPVAIERPRWLERPRDLARYYPRRAIPRGVEGEVLLDCLVTTVGTLNCAVLSEAPQDWGFGDAALRIARDHRMVPAMRDGRAVEGRYRMRVPFELE